MDLTPRTVTDLERPAPPRRRRGWAPALVLALVLAGVAVLLFQFLRSASLYFCNADEVGQKVSCSEGRRFRVQGNVENLDSSESDAAAGTVTATRSPAHPARASSHAPTVTDSGRPVPPCPACPSSGTVTSTP